MVKGEAVWSFTVMFLTIWDTYHLYNDDKENGDNEEDHTKNSFFYNLDNHRIKTRNENRKNYYDFRNGIL